MTATFINKHKRSHMSHDSMVSLQRFFIRQSPNWTEKKAKSSLYNVSILENNYDSKKVWSSPLSFSGGGGGEMKVDVVLCVKSIRVHAHTPAHTHISYSQIEFSPFQEMNLRRSAEILLVLCRPLSPQPAFSYSVIPTFHRMTPQHPENFLRLVSHPQKQAAGGSNRGKIKIAPLILYITMDCWSLSCGKVVPSPPCMIVKHWYKICPCSLALRGWKQKRKWVFYYIFQYWTLLFSSKLKCGCARNIMTRLNNLHLASYLQALQKYAKE